MRTDTISAIMTGYADGVVQSIRPIHASILQSVQSTLKCEIMINILIFTFFRIPTPLFLKFDPLAHVADLGSDSSMQKNWMIFKVNYDGHVQ